MKLNIDKLIIEVFFNQKLNLMMYNKSNYDDSELVVVTEYEATTQTVYINSNS
jgi:hypothetical protein